MNTKQNKSKADVKEKMLDKTLAESFPASDPLSSIPNPETESLSEKETSMEQSGKENPKSKNSDRRFSGKRRRSSKA